MFRCWLSGYFTWFLLSYYSVGGFGIAIYRLLYIKASTLVKYVIGDKVMLLIIGFGGIMVSFNTLGILPILSNIVVAT